MSNQFTNPVPAIELIIKERKRQDDKWGKQSHTNGTGHFSLVEEAARARMVCERAFKNDVGTWRHILDEEVREAFAENDPDALFTELTHVAAVAVAWMEDLIEKADDEQGL